MARPMMRPAHRGLNRMSSLSWVIISKPTKAHGAMTITPTVPMSGGISGANEGSRLAVAAAGLIAYQTEKLRNRFAYIEPSMKLFTDVEVVDPFKRTRKRGSFVERVKGTISNLGKELF